MSDAPEVTIYTIGHSTRSLEEFVNTLKTYEIRLLADVRSMPGSRKYPHFNMENLQSSLEQEGISYLHLRKLGGRRQANKDSRNLGWRNMSFRAYADYMQTEDFNHGLEELTSQANHVRTAIMCAEAVPWRCHRSLVADALLVRGYQVMDIFSSTKQNAHHLTSFAQVEGLKITYPAA